LMFWHWIFKENWKQITNSLRCSAVWNANSCITEIQLSIRTNNP
jgi:hypothetical protein